MPPSAAPASILEKPRRVLKTKQWNGKIPLSPLNPDMSRYKEYLYRLAKYQKYLVDLENYKKCITMEEISKAKQYLLQIAATLHETFEKNIDRNRKRKRDL